MRTRYQLLKDFFFLYGCIWSIIYALKIISDLTGTKLPYSDATENPYTFFVSLVLVLLISPYVESLSGKKTIADYFPHADKVKYDEQ